jgi:hypothetical protein
MLPSMRPSRKLTTITRWCCNDRSTAAITEPSSTFVAFVLRQLDCARLRTSIVLNDQRAHIAELEAARQADVFGDDEPTLDNWMGI